MSALLTNHQPLGGVDNIDMTCANFISQIYMDQTGLIYNIIHPGKTLGFNNCLILVRF